MSELKDLTGKRFGRWTVKYLVCKHRENGAPATIWHCVCDCGTEKDVRASNLISGGSKSCGCLSKECSGKTAKNILGMRFGMLTVIKKSESKNKRATWLCRCDCGKEVIVKGNSLLNGNTRSCGCLRKEKVHDLSKTHGGSKDRLYTVWKGMRSRCNNPKNKDYKNYGGRGISICEEWNDYSKFKKWAYDTGYKKDAQFGDCTIERINVNGNYSPENCTWIPLSEQAKNKHHISAE